MKNSSRIRPKAWLRWHVLGAAFLLVMAAGGVSRGEVDPPKLIYVGSEACRECHPEEYANFMQYAKKSTSFQSVQKQVKHLSQEEIEKCYYCHTTGYGKPGGFVSIEETPHLRNAGCEVCHGPGSEHVRTGETGSITGKMNKRDCEPCHISERVRAFKYKPLVHGGAH